MSKYIVEIEHVPSLEDYSVDLRPDTVNGEHAMFRISGIDHLVFDRSCLKNFQPVEALIDSTHYSSYAQGLKDGYRIGFADGKKEFHEYDYQNGLDTAWNAIKILLGRDDRKEYNFEFCGLTASEIIHQFPVDEVVARLKTQLDSTFLCAGDEVEIGGKKVVVTRVPEDDPGRFCYIDHEGRTYANNSYEEFKKTGRHFPIEDLLGQMEVPKE